MKISNLIQEQQDHTPSKNRLNFNDLTAIEVAAIRGVADGRVDFENASDRMLDVLEQLKDYGLLDQSYELTQSGLKANELAKKYGSYEKRQAQERKSKEPQKQPELDQNRYDDIDDPSDEGEVDDRY